MFSCPRVNRHYVIIIPYLSWSSVDRFCHRLAESLMELRMITTYPSKHPRGELRLDYSIIHDETTTALYTAHVVSRPNGVRCCLPPAALSKRGPLSVWGRGGLRLVPRAVIKNGTWLRGATICHLSDWADHFRALLHTPAVGRVYTHTPDTQATIQQYYYCTYIHIDTSPVLYLVHSLLGAPIFKSPLATRRDGMKSHPSLLLVRKKQMGTRA